MRGGICVCAVMRRMEQHRKRDRRKCNRSDKDTWHRVMRSFLQDADAEALAHLTTSGTSPSLAGRKVRPRHPSALLSKY
jgi:hypothetical protein